MTRSFALRFPPVPPLFLLSALPRPAVDPLPPAIVFATTTTSVKMLKHAETMIRFLMDVGKDDELDVFVVVEFPPP